MGSFNAETLTGSASTPRCFKCHSGMSCTNVYSCLPNSCLHIKLCKEHLSSWIHLNITNIYICIFYLHWERRNWNIEMKRKIGWSHHSYDPKTDSSLLVWPWRSPWVESEIFLPDRCTSDLRPFPVPYGSKTDWPTEEITPCLFVCFEASTRVTSYPGDLTCQIHLPHSFIRFRRRF